MPYESPLYFSLAGYWYGSLERVGYVGDFWSPVVYSSRGAYVYYANVNGAGDPSRSYGRNAGISVRCLAR